MTGNKSPVSTGHNDFGEGNMIKFSLCCERNHIFDSWFESNKAFETLNSKQLLTCPICNSTLISKNIMAPNIVAKENSTKNECLEQKEEKKIDLQKPLSKYEEALQTIKKELEKNSEYVGKKFVEQARMMYQSSTEKRSIHGEASLKEAKELVEEGIPVTPLPWPVVTDTN